MFDSKKKVKLTNAEGVEYKLARKQLQAIDFNKALLAMYTNQVAKRPLCFRGTGEQSWMIFHIFRFRY